MTKLGQVLLFVITRDSFCSLFDSTVVIYYVMAAYNAG